MTRDYIAAELFIRFVADADEKGDSYDPHKLADYALKMADTFEGALRDHNKASFKSKQKEPTSS